MNFKEKLEFKQNIGVQAIKIKTVIVSGEEVFKISITFEIQLWIDNFVLEKQVKRMSFIVSGKDYEELKKVVTI